ncbi:hypothetical protein, partial [Klebsiella quasipneumoniae]|uniref:hypothetical protein n=1 Tax=Klebsiella quasipneumoniae TaxID=1463165 RepID=UPI0038615861
MKKILFCSLLLLSASSFAQQFHYQCEGRDLKIMLSPNAAFLDGKSFEYKNGETGNDSNLLIVFYVQIMPDDFVM